jgi:hypothetical protein
MAMNPIKQIGRYQFPIGSVASVKKRSGLKGFFLPGYDVTLIGGATFRLNAAEKKRLDDEMQLHSETMQVMGMIGFLQAANRPA